MKRLLWIVMLSTLTLTAKAYDRIVYVTNPDLMKYEMTWSGPAPNCHETNLNGDTYGWIYHNYNAPPVDVYIKLKALNTIACTIIISDDVKSYFPSVIGNNCYFIKSNGSDKIYQNSSYSTWVTTTDAIPYQSHACGP